jgi:hypothetical protein
MEPAGGRSLLINGHIDVISPGERERWTSDPFAGHIRDSRLYGRGAVDMKGGIAAALFALQVLREAGVRSPAMSSSRSFPTRKRARWERSLRSSAATARTQASCPSPPA